MGFGDQADRARQHLRLLANGARQGHLVALAHRNPCLGNKAAGGDVDQIDAALLELLTPSPKTDPGDVRESNQPEGLERILYEEATQCRADRSVLTSSGRGSGEGTEGSRGL